MVINGDSTVGAACTGQWAWSVVGPHVINVEMVRDTDIVTTKHCADLRPS